MSYLIFDNNRVIVQNTVLFLILPSTMIEYLFEMLNLFDDMIWSYVCFPVIVGVGIYFSAVSRCIQIRRFPVVIKTFFSFLTKKGAAPSDGAKAVGIHPLKASLACIGASVGIGNIISITTAVQIGGPGALFWIWVTAIIGSLVKYSEVFLGMKFRVNEGNEGYRGGPMFFLEKAFSSWAAKLFCVLMCLYGVEIAQFSAVTEALSYNFELPKLPVAIGLLGLVLFAEKGGINRVGTICSAVIPLFIAVYMCMGIYIIGANINMLPSVILDVFTYAFTPAAATGGFLGSAVLMTISQGIRRSCYSSDIGVGYASIVHSETREKVPAKQASLTIFEVFLDVFVICTMSVIIVLVTNSWTENTGAPFLIQIALAKYFPYVHVFMPIFIFMLGYSTIITYFCAGIKTAEFLFPKWGRHLYYALAAVSFITFSFLNLSHAITVMSLVLACLLLLNSIAILKLRHIIKFEIEADEVIFNNETEVSTAT